MSREGAVGPTHGLRPMLRRQEPRRPPCERQQHAANDTHQQAGGQRCLPKMRTARTTDDALVCAGHASKTLVHWHHFDDCDLSSRPFFANPGSTLIRRPGYQVCTLIPSAAATPSSSRPRHVLISGLISGANEARGRVRTHQCETQVAAHSIPCAGTVSSVSAHLKDRHGHRGRSGCLGCWRPTPPHPASYVPTS